MAEITVRRAVVREVTDSSLVVRIEREDEECGGCSSCAMKSLCRGRDEGVFETAVPRNGAVCAPGDTVQVACREPNPALAAAVMFLPGLLGLAAGGFGAEWLAGPGDMVFLGGAFSGLFLGFALTFLLTRCCSSLRAGAVLAEPGCLPPAV